MNELQYKDEIRRLRFALQWYARQAAGCRKITPEGDVARRKLNDDGGKLARGALGEDAT